LGLVGVASATIQVLHPKDLKTALKDEGYIEASLGNFGHVLYGTSIVRPTVLMDLAGPRVLPACEPGRVQRVRGSGPPE
jgi:hypothetical protein